MKKKTKDYLKYKVATNTESTFHSICTRYIPNAISEVVKLAPKLKGKTDLETCKKIDRFIRDNITYKNDEPGYEEIRFPNRLLADKVGDCEDFTILGSAVLQNLGVAHTVRMADYGKGWQHIYIKVGNITLDPVQERFNQEDKGKYLDFHINPKGHGLGLLHPSGLGALEKSLYTEREVFLLALWQEFAKDGIKVIKGGTRLLNQIPTKKIAELPTYIKERLGYDTNVIVNYKDKKEDALEIKFKGNTTNLIIDPTYLSDLVNRIGGSSALVYKPTETESGLSPYNPKLMDYLKPFCSKDQFRPAMHGVYFNKTEVVATDAYILVVIKGKTDYTGIYGFDRKEIDENYPKYQAVIDSIDTPNKITVHTKDFKQMVSTALKSVNSKSLVILPTMYGISIITENVDYENESISKQGASYIGNPCMLFFTGNPLLSVLNLLIKEGVKKVTIEFDDSDKPVLIRYQGTYGETLVALTKRIYYGKDNVRITYQERFPEYIKEFEKDLGNKLLQFKSKLAEL
jgi:hypothetical protein